MGDWERMRIRKHFRTLIVYNNGNHIQYCNQTPQNSLHEVMIIDKDLLVAGFQTDLKIFTCG